jgi:ketosteroid isomerase-like protein
MSEENVEVIRAAMAAFNARDPETMLSLMDPNVEFESAIERKVYRGHDGMVRYRREADAVMQGFHTEEDRFLDAGDDRVVHLYRIVGTGAGSGVPGSRENAIIWVLRDGKILRAKVYLDPRQALEAVGLSQ